MLLLYTESKYKFVTGILLTRYHSQNFADGEEYT